MLYEGRIVDKKITIRDVATKAGVSISSVHFALSGQPGVSEETRSKIRKVAQELGYQPNPLASNLKRRARRIVILLPSDDEEGQYYYQMMWSGVRDYLSKVNVKLDPVELPFYDKNKLSVFQQMIQLAKAGEVHGILTVGHMDEAETKEGWYFIQEKGIPVVSVGSDLAHCPCLCSIQPEYGVIGRTMAQLITDHIPSFGSILLCAGNPKWAAHTLVVRGFEDYLRENGCENLVYRDNSWLISRENYENIYEKLSRPDIAAACSVYSQGTVMLGQALEESGKAPRIYAVGSDLPETTADRISRGVINVAIQKNPYVQAYVGVRYLVEYLSSGKIPEQPRVYVGSEVVLKSNLTMHNNKHYLYLLQ